MKKLVIFLLAIACYNNSFGMFTKKLMNTIKTKTHNKYYSIHDEEPFQTSDLHKIINCNKATPAFTQEQQTIKPNNDLLTENNALLHKIIKQNKENNELLKALIKQNYVNAGHDGINSFHRY